LEEGWERIHEKGRKKRKGYARPVKRTVISHIYDPRALVGETVKRGGGKIRLTSLGGALGKKSIASGTENTGFLIAARK